MTAAHLPGCPAGPLAALHQLPPCDDGSGTQQENEEFNQFEYSPLLLSPPSLLLLARFVFLSMKLPIPRIGNRVKYVQYQLSNIPYACRYEFQQDVEKYLNETSDQQ